MYGYRKVRTMTATDAAYLAGLIDGEGTITLSKRHRNENRQLVVSISNNEKHLLDHVKSVTGVGVITRKPGSKAGHGINYSYKVSNRQALELLEQVTGHLKGYKKQRACLILKKYLLMTPRNGK